MVDDTELRRRLEILKHRFEDGKIVIAEHLAQGFQESFGRVKCGEDGEIDLDTVDGRVRSMAMMAAAMNDRDEMKTAASLIDIQNAYYDRITPMFSEVHKMMHKYHGHPQSISSAFSRDEAHVNENYPLIAPFISELREFWEVVSEPVRYHLQDMRGLKGVFGGDLFPSYERNIASSTGLYLDTIVLTDPFMNSFNMFERWEKSEAVRMFLKHGLQLMNYRELAISDLSVPIVVILPFESAHNEHYRDSLFNASSAKAAAHAEKLFGRNFQDLNDLRDFLESYKTPDEISAVLTDKTRLLFDTEWEGDPATQIERAMKEFAPMMGDTVADLILGQCLGRMSQATDVAWKSLSLGGVPLIDAPTSWEYYNWSLEYGAERDAVTDVPLHITRGMQRLAQTDMEWLGDIPPDALIEIRKQGALDDMREMLSGGVEDVAALNPGNFFRSADKIYDNLEAGFAAHQKAIDDLRAKKWKFAGRDVGSWVVAGSVEVAAAIFGTPAWGLASVAVSQFTDAPKIKDIPKLAKELRREGQALSRSAAGLLFKHRH